MAEKAFNFTKDRLIKIEAPKTNQDTYKDLGEKGLILIVSYGGSKTFYLAKKIQQKFCRIRIGRFPDLSLIEARAKAVELKNQIANGINPTKNSKTIPLIDDDTNAEMTFKQLFDKYTSDYAKYNIKKWQEDIVMMDRRAKHLYNTGISSVSRDDMQQIFNLLTENVGKIAANRFLQRLTGIFNKAIEWSLIDKNPTSGIKKHKEKSRKRFINQEEMPRFLAAINAEPNQKMADFFLIALLTGARKGNVLSMQWQNINWEDKTWYIADTKNGEPQSVHLVQDAIKILQNRNNDNPKSVWVFASNTSQTGHLQEPKKIWKRICQQAKLDDLRIHDLRRTHGTWMRKAGADRDIIGEALNHKSSKSTEVYDIIESDQVKEYREKATKTMMNSPNNRQAHRATNNQEDDVETLRNKIAELERKLKAFANI